MDTRVEKRRRGRGWMAALAVLLLACALPASAQERDVPRQGAKPGGGTSCPAGQLCTASVQPPGGGGDVTPPTITVTPGGGTFYIPSFAITVGWCDNASLNANTRTVTLNGVHLSNSTTVTNKAGCGSYAWSSATLNLVVGDNTLTTSICDSSGNCATKTTLFRYLTADATAPTVTITPGTGNNTTGTVSPTLTWCDDRSLDGFRVTYNGVDVTSTFGYATLTGTAGTSCSARASSDRGNSGALAILPGTNTLTAEVRDSAGNWGSKTAVYTFQPLLDTSPTNQDNTGPGMFDAVLSYATASYRSLDQDRSVALVYASSTARPTATIQVDVTDNSADPATRTSLALTWNGVTQTLPDGRTSVHFTTGAGTNRLTAVYGASSTPTGSMDMVAVVTRYWPDGRTQELQAPVRVLVINDGASPFGAGWGIAGVERVVPTQGGILLTHGDGSGTFHPAYTWCNAQKVCHYGHSAGYFGSMAYDSVNARYVRWDRDGGLSYFDATGRLTRVQDRLGNAQVYGYTGTQLTSITDPAGRVTTLGYDAAGKLATLTDPAGRVTRTTVNASGDLVTITEPDSVVALQMTYPSGHRLGQYVDRAAGQWNLTYDAFGRLATAQGPSFTAEGGQTFRHTTTLASIPAVTQGSITAGTAAAPLPRVDPATLRVTLTDPRGQVTRVALDRWDAPSRVEDPFGYVATTTRNGEGQTTLTIDPAGNATAYTWSMGDLLRVSSSAGTVEMAHDGWGNVTTVTGLGMERYNHFDANGLLDWSAQGNDTTRFTYDARGRTLTATDGEGHVTTYTYDAASVWNNLVTETSGGRTTTWRYDAYGRVAGVTNPQGRESTFTYDVLNRLRTHTAPDLGVTEYVWGPAYLNRVTDARGQNHKWTRNALGFPERESRPGDATGANLLAEYDRYGRVTAAVNRRGGRVTMTYDAHDRVATRTADGQTTTFSYSPDNPSTPAAPGWFAVANGESVDTVRYDGKGRVTETVSVRMVNGVPQRYVVQPRYDGWGRTLGFGISSPAGRDTLGYGYDAQTGRLSRMVDAGRGTTTFGYDHDGMLSAITLPTGQGITRSFTALHRLEEIRYGSLAVDGAAGVRYAFDVMDRVASRRNVANDRLRTFAYDLNTGSLSTSSDFVGSGPTRPTCEFSVTDGYVCNDPQAVWTPAGSETFAYDKVGSPLDRGAVQGTGYRLSAFNGYTLAYDADGNLVSKTKPGYTQTLTWNALGQLASVTTNGVTVTYGYDGAGQRVRRTLNGVSTGYLYSGDNLLLEYDGNGVQAKYTYYPGSGIPHSVVRGAQKYYYGADTQGSVLAVFDSLNQLKNQYSYQAFGEPQTAVETVPNRLRYAGRELEAESGLYYNRARWYDPSLHRFVSEDPIGLAGGINLYAYVGNDPVNYTDPSGLEMMADPECAEGDVPDVTKPGVCLHRNRDGSVTPYVPLKPISATAQRPPMPDDFNPEPPVKDPRSQQQLQWTYQASMRVAGARRIWAAQERWDAEDERVCQQRRTNTYAAAINDGIAVLSLAMPLAGYKAAVSEARAGFATAAISRGTMERQITRGAAPVWAYVAAGRGAAGGLTVANPAQPEGYTAAIGSSWIAAIEYARDCT